MSKRSITVGVLVLALPVLGFALLRMRAASPRAAAVQQEPALPEAIANLQRKIDNGTAKIEFDETLGYLRVVAEDSGYPCFVAVAGVWEEQRTAIPHFSAEPARVVFQR
jgi:hypothetical protein